MKITSPAFAHNGMIPKKYTCQGEDARPLFEISDPPADTKSLAIIVQDPDAPTGDFVHWIIWDISPEVQEIGEDTIPVGAVEGISDFGRMGWGGPCPPSGTHRYEFYLYALDSPIRLPAGSNKTDFRNEITGHILEEAQLIGLYEKS